MSVFTEWLNANEQRNYPIHDQASRLSSLGIALPNNLITDANIWFPRSAGVAVMLSGVGITPFLATATFTACPVHPFMPGSSSSSGAPSQVPIAAVRARLPVEVGRLYQLEAIYPGVTGWISFGSGANSIQGFWNFAGPEASVLQERCIMLMPDVPVETLAKEGASPLLYGLIQLKGTPGSIKTFKAARTILVGGQEITREVGVIALDLGADRVTRLQELAGPCAGRPDTQTCPVRPIEKINSVHPDSAGDIQLVFEGSMSVGDVREGMVVDHPTNLDELCPYGFNPDIINPPPGPPTPPVPPTPSSSSVPPYPSSSSSSSGSEYCDDFQLGFAKELDVVTGSFTVQTTGESSSSSSGGPPPPPPDKRYVSAAGSLLPQFAIDIYRELDASLAPYMVKGTIRPRAVSGNGFLIAGYKNSNSFVFAGLSLKDGGKFFVGRKVASGGNWPNGLGYGYSFILPITRSYPMPLTDYRVFWLLDDPNNSTVRFVWNDGSQERMQQVSFSWAPGVFNVQGRAGLGVVGAETEFDNYGINCGGSSSSGF